MTKILESYLRRLTNLSSNNRSLLLSRLISDQSIDIHDFNHASGKPSFDIVEGLISGKAKIPLVQEVDTHDIEGNKLSRRLKKMLRIEKFIFQERGSKDMYVGWPFVQGKFSDDTLVRGPLIFFPVELKLEGNRWFLIPRADVNITFNKSLLLAYAHFNGTSPDEELIETTLTDLDHDPVIFRTKLYEILKQSRVEIDFNRENFTDRLRAFANYKKSNLQTSEKSGKLKLQPEAVLGIFPQSGSYLVPDYLKLLEDSNEDLGISSFFERRIKENPEEESKIKFSDKVKEENTFTPFPMDASQERALELIKKNNSLVIQGPPGTGKSQLISNLICDFIARGKRVLLVCQKKAALDVVFDRLKSKEMHDFIGLVHDFKNDRKNIFEQIARQIDNVDKYRQKNNGLDAIYLERAHLQASRKIEQNVEELDEFKKALFDEKECGKSAKELYLLANPEETHIPLNQDYRNFHYDQLPAFTQKLKRYLDYHQRLDKLDFWKDRPSYSNLLPSDLTRVKEVLDDIISFQKALIDESKTFLKTAIDFETCLYFLSHRKSIRQLSNNLDNETVFTYFQKMQPFAPHEEKWLLQTEKSILRCFKGSGMEQSLPSGELGRFQESLEYAIKARKGLFSWLKWKLFSKDKLFVTRVLVSNGLKGNSEGLDILLSKIDNRLNYEHLLSEISGRLWLTSFPKGYRVISIQNWFFYQKLALKSSVLTEKIRTLTEFVPHKSHTRETYVKLLSRMLDFLDAVPTQLQIWSRYFSESQIRKVALQKEDLNNVKAQVNGLFDVMVEFDKIKQHLTNSEQKVVEELFSKSQSTDEVLSILANSVALAWIDHIESKYPILRSVSSLRIDHLKQSLQEAIKQKMEVSEQILLLKAREKTYEDLEYNRLNNLISYRDLYHQVTKQRRVWPIRRVISQFTDELFSLLPCWMASPESASAIFPMEEIFDLVIFDEASQCFAERGIPGMFRGKQVVIAGDEQQLQPNDLYRVRWESDDEEENPATEVDSLLKLASQYLPQVALTGHYRSSSLPLIEFSNKHFYNGKLRLLPTFERINLDEPPIKYFKKNGIWENNCNQMEAETVVSLVTATLKKHPKKEVGVVTFNTYQQGLILDLLDKAGLILPDTCFVKNIENVQGDEKDLIIFSTAYAQDRTGKLQMKFGSLNNRGGENRLNVAITRARDEVYIVTSLLPWELNTDGLKNQGPKLLKAYLEYAHDVSHGKWKPDISQASAHAPEWYLKKRLMDEGQAGEFTSELAFADVTVKDGGSYKGLILTDDDIYYESLSAKEAHAYRQEQFLEKHWPYLEIFSREACMNRAGVREKLAKFQHRINQ